MFCYWGWYRSGVRIRIVPVKVRGQNSTQDIETYALFDSGSDVSICKSNLARQLGIIGTPTTFTLTTINERRKRSRDGKSMCISSIVEILTCKDKLSECSKWILVKCACKIGKRNVRRRPEGFVNHGKIGKTGGRSLSNCFTLAR